MFEGKVAAIESDYSNDTFLRIAQTIDYDIVVGISGVKDGEFRIATSGSRYWGSEHKNRFIKLCSELIDVMKAMREEYDRKRNNQ